MKKVQSKASFKESNKSFQNQSSTKAFNNNPLEKYGVISMVDYIN